ncbi:phenylalanine--tRNA ligase subunit beta [Microlunatus speluncae]|uniref:phenylalanine--tRNA ligase subunit beta n=1 Tax=Microlunatus speluncae TaxID=2594267 RepID=UPI0012662C5D|nr:phenylalanine--tRNA ligase subunit beta [Microlunatus speluncae]
MRAPLSWLREYAPLPAGTTGRDVSEALIKIGFEVESVDRSGGDITGPLVIGRVLEFTEQEQKNGKIIRWCRVDVGEHNNGSWAKDSGGDDTTSRGIICGARNFAVDDLVVVALPGAVLPGGFEIAARKTYGHISDGMICAADELELGDDHSGIMVLTGDDLVLGADARPVLGLGEEVLDIAVTPDRGYAWSVRGLARETAHAFAVGYTDPVDRPVPASAADGYPVRLESPACPLFVAITVTGVDPAAPSPRWLKQRLQQAGMRPISLAVDVTNYVMLETGQPLHAYDADLLAGPIVVRQARAGESIKTLDDVDRLLDQDDLVITDDSGPIGIAGVMGGETTEVGPETATLVIEAAHFEAISIARTSRRHKLSSEASRRFERGVDPGASYAAAQRVAALLVEHGGGQVSAAETIAGAVPEVPTLRLDPALPGKIMGDAIDVETVLDHLRQVGVAVTAGDQLEVTPPTWRPDLRDPYDFVEEVGRLYGYDRVPSVLPPAPSGRGLTRSQRSRRLINAALAQAGYVEVLSFPFLGAGDLDLLELGADDERRRTMEIANPLSETQPLLRTTILPGLIAAAHRNTSRGLDDLALYETGSVFFAPEQPTAAPRPAVEGRPSVADLAAMDAAIGHQPRHAAALIAGNWRPAGWSGPAEPADWRHAVAFAETAARAVGATITVKAAARTPWHPGRCAELSVAGRVIGHAGELHPRVVEAAGLPARACAVEFDCDALITAAPDRGTVAPISAHPVAKEDVALIVDAEVAAADVEAALVTGAGALLESVRLFDIYTGPQIGEGKKSLAYALRFRAPDRTLTDAESAQARDAAVTQAATTLNAHQRTL